MSEDYKEFTIPEILESFKVADGVYKREQVDAAVKLKNEITPYLIDVLKNVLADPYKYSENGNFIDHFYAFILLGHFNETGAHQVIIDLFSLPDKLPDQMFWDMITEHLPDVLFNTCGGSFESIKTLILNKKADQFCRNSACRAMAYGVIEGYLSRKEVLTFFGTLFTKGEDFLFLDLLANVVCDLYPEEIMHVIKQAYENDLIIPKMIQYSEFEDVLKIGKDKCLAKIKSEFERQSLDDIHESMSWWSCFEENPESAPISSSLKEETFPESSVPSTQRPGKCKNIARRKRKKRKQAKASKQKSRR